MKPESTTLIVSAIELASKRNTEEADGTGEVLRRRPELALAPHGREGPEGNLGCSHNGHAALTCHLDVTWLTSITIRSGPVSVET
jgi:hypothetical protein